MSYPPVNVINIAIDFYEPDAHYNSASLQPCTIAADDRFSHFDKMF